MQAGWQGPFPQRRPIPWLPGSWQNSGPSQGRGLGCRSQMPSARQGSPPQSEELRHILVQKVPPGSGAIPAGQGFAQGPLASQRNPGSVLETMQSIR